MNGPYYNFKSRDDRSDDTVIQHKYRQRSKSIGYPLIQREWFGQFLGNWSVIVTSTQFRICDWSLSGKLKLTCDKIFASFNLFNPNFFAAIFEACRSISNAVVPKPLPTGLIGLCKTSCLLSARLCWNIQDIKITQILTTKVVPQVHSMVHAWFHRGK